jgi:PKD repeat protein
MPTPLAALVCVLTLAAPAPQGQEQASAGLAEGRRLVREGALDDALVALDATIRELAADPKRAHDLALANAYLAEVYLGLGQPSLAEAKLLKALDAEPELALDPLEFPRNVRQALDEARKVRRERGELGRQAKRKSRKGGIIALGAGGAVAAGVAIAVVPKERENRPPTATVTVSPEGTAVRDATRVSFTATVSDPDGEPVSVDWNFGDGSSAQGTVTSHVYASEGTFTVTATAKDGLTSTSVTTTVTVRSLTGAWRPDATGCDGEVRYDIQQSSGGTLLVGVQFDKPDVIGSTLSQRGTVTNPRRVSFSYGEFIPSLGYSRCSTITFTGDADSTIQRIGGTVTYNTGTNCPCLGQQRATTLVR